jgi:hypothetical protein
MVERIRKIVKKASNMDGTAPERVPEEVAQPLTLVRKP